MADGSITLFQVAAHTKVLAVACSRCDRAGRYRLDTLIAGRSRPKGSLQVRYNPAKPTRDLICFLWHWPLPWPLVAIQRSKLIRGALWLPSTALNLNQMRTVL